MRAGRRSDRPLRRASISAVCSVLVCVAAATTSVATSAVPASRSPNVLLVITDDQPWDSLSTTNGPAAMPWLESRLADPDDRWVRFTNAVVDVPLCCPSRASILTGLSSRHTGVEGNGDGADLDESSTLATWLDDAGYQTAFIGKYLNGYPWDRGPYVPAGWDRFLAKRNLDLSTTYLGYPFVDQGVPMSAGTGVGSYATSMLAAEASAFLRGASTERPWFLVFAPSAPHAPWTPAPHDAGTLARAPIPLPDLHVMNDVRDKPDWVRNLRAIDAATATTLRDLRRRMLETLTEVDRALRTLVDEVEARGELGNTLVVFLSDNGYSFGEHRWVGKRCPYDACVRIPLVVRSPWTSAHMVPTPVSNVDLAPTVLDLTGLAMGAEPVDGRSLMPMLDDRVVDAFDRDAVLIEWAGDGEVPPWRGVRAEDFSYVEAADGTIELYDLTGRLGPADPGELRNRAGDPRSMAVQRSLAASLEALMTQDPVPILPRR
jgi:N-acetylglucosamine-6-sulfatase